MSSIKSLEEQTSSKLMRLRNKGGSQTREQTKKHKTRSSTMDPHFFLPPAFSVGADCSAVVTFPNITTPLPSMKATRERPSQCLKVSHTRGCWGSKLHSAISFDLRECGSSIFLPPVSLPIFQESFEILQ